MRRPGAPRLAAALLAALALAGCGAVQSVREKLPSRQPLPGPEASAYAGLRDAHSRRARLYDGLVHRADLSGTWISPEVRVAGTRQVGEWLSWSHEELAAALEAGQRDAAKGEEFVLALYTAKQDQNDLDAPAPTWRIELDDGDDQAVAAAVEAMKSDATTLQLFPYVSRFDKVWRVRLPWKGAPLADRPFVLRVSSALGTMTLDFGPGGARAERPHQAP